MLSGKHLRFEIQAGVLRPGFIDGRYTELARALVVHYQAFQGKPWRELDGALRTAPEVSCHNPRLVGGLREVIEEPMAREVLAPVDPRLIREAVFRAAGEMEEIDEAAALATAAGKLGIAAGLRPEHLYADLRPERGIAFPRSFPPISELITRYNFRLLQGLVAHSATVRVNADGQARAIYRLAKLHGLLVEVKAADGSGGQLDLEVTGPLSLFRLTRKYGRALARFLPACATANRWRLHAKVAVGGRWAALTVSSEDGILSPHLAPRQFDSKLEERFLADFLALRSPWTIAREEQIIQLGRSAFIPDFTLRWKTDPCFRVDLEIVGFWTRDYLARKRSLTTRLAGRRIIFCLDQRLRCGPEECPFPCLHFTRRVPATAVLEALNRLRSEVGKT